MYVPLLPNRNISHNRPQTNCKCIYNSFDLMQLGLRQQRLCNNVICLQGVGLPLRGEMEIKKDEDQAISFPSAKWNTTAIKASLMRGRHPGCQPCVHQTPLIAATVFWLELGDTTGKQANKGSWHNALNHKNLLHNWGTMKGKALHILLWVNPGSADWWEIEIKHTTHPLSHTGQCTNLLKYKFPPG